MRSTDYVVTPNGLFHRSCVIPLQRNEHLLKNGTVTRDNATVRTLSPCKYPHYLRNGKMISADKTSRPTNDWVAFASKPLDPLQLVSARWVVPAAPARSASQVLYYFPGIEPAYGSVIAQPVLQWYSPSQASSGMPVGWSIASWYCCSNDNTSFSEPVAVKQGDTISGAAQGAQCDAGTGACASWSIITHDTTTGQATTFIADKNSGASVEQPLTWGVGASLEEWFVDVNACNEYSADTETFSDIRAVSVKGASLDPTWDRTVSGVGQECSFSLAAAGTISIAHGDKATITPAPMGRCLCGGTWPNDCVLCSSATSGEGEN